MINKKNLKPLNIQQTIDITNLERGMEIRYYFAIINSPRNKNIVELHSPQTLLSDIDIFWIFRSVSQ